MSLPVLVKVPDGEIGGYDRGSVSNSTPALVILQEIFGVNENIRRTVDRFAEQGFRAVAPDLFWRQRPNVDLDPNKPETRAEAMQLAEAYGLEAAGAVDDLRRVLEWLRAQHQKVGVVGYCLGGKMALLCWIHGGFDAAAIYYGVGMAQHLEGDALPSTPLLMHLGALDPLNPPETQRQIVESLQRASSARVIVHDGVGHAFARLGGLSYVPSTAEMADRETMQFLKEQLS